MAAQDIVSLGIDISSFTPAKLKKLDDFIIAFDKLEKYDGKTFNPIIGGGLTDFNNSILQTGKLLDDLNVKLNSFASQSQSSTKKASDATKQLTYDQIALKDQIDKMNTSRAASVQATQEQINKDKLWAANDAKNKSEAISSQKTLTNEIKAYEIQLAKSQSKQITQDIRDRTKAQRDLQTQQQESIRNDQREQASLKLLRDDYALLKQAQKDQQTTYTNLLINKGSGNSQTKQALAEYTATTATVNDLEKQLTKAGKSSDNFGVSLTRGLGYLRTLAYVLPGIGLAGIFNLAFEAIEGVVKEIGLIKPTQDEIAESQIKVNKEYESFLDILKEIKNTLSSNLNETTSGVETFKSLEDEVRFSKELGKSKLDILETEKKLLVNQSIQAQDQFNINGGFEKEAKLRGQILSQEDDLKVLIKARAEEQGKADKNDDPNFKSVYDQDILLAKSKIELAEKQYNEVKSINEKNSQLNQDLSSKDIEIEEHKAEQIRKLALETAKTNAQSVIDSNNVILKSDLSTEKERIGAAQRIESANIRIQEAQKSYTLSKNDARNADGQLTTESKDTILQANESEKQAITKSQEEQLKIRTEFFQRRLKATTEINKDEIESDAIAQEKIYQNDKISFDKRIAAYNAYILDKQLIQNLELNKDLQSGASTPGGKTSLTPEEKDKLQADKTKEDLNIQANAQKEIYDIIYSSLEKELKTIKDHRKEESDYSKEQYIEDLTALNERLERREITVARYNDLRKKLDRKDQKEVLLQQIVDDEIYLAELRKFKEKQLDVEVQFAAAKLKGAQAGGDKYQIDKAQGEYDAALAAQNDFNKAISEGVKKEQDDRLKLAKLGGADENKERKKWAEAAIEIEKALYESIKKLGDEDYQRRIELIEKRKDLLDENFQSEQEAIDKSSLSAKDKAALDIQLSAQKQELDNKAAADERELKIKQFEFDRKLAIGNIIISTAAGIAKAIPDVPKEIAAGAVGAIELATAIAQEPPAYKDGTRNHPGGLARFAEVAPEWVKEPYKSPYLVMSETISYLPKGTEVIPIKDSPIFGERIQGDGWEQTKWLGNQMRKNNKEIKNIFRPIINIDLGFENYKRSKLYGR